MWTIQTAEFKVQELHWVSSPRKREAQRVLGSACGNIDTDKYAVKKLRESIVEGCQNGYTLITALWACNQYERMAGKC